MKRLSLLILFTAISAVSGLAQSSWPMPPGLIWTSADPTGVSCPHDASHLYYPTTGQEFTCVAGVYVVNYGRFGHTYLKPTASGNAGIEMHQDSRLTSFGGLAVATPVPAGGAESTCDVNPPELSWDLNYLYFCGSDAKWHIYGYSVASNKIQVGTNTLLATGAAGNIQVNSLGGIMIAVPVPIAGITLGGTCNILPPEVAWDDNYMYVCNPEGKWEAARLLTALSGNGISTKTANYTATTNDRYIICDAGGGAVTITLPPTPNDAEEIDVKKKDLSSNYCTVGGNGHNIDGDASRNIASSNSSLHMVYQLATTNWWIF